MQPGQISVDRRGYNILLQCNEDYSGQLRKISNHVELTKEKNRELKKKVARCEQDCKSLQKRIDKLSKEADAAAENFARRQSAIGMIANGLFRELVREFPAEEITMGDQSVFIEIKSNLNPTAGILVKRVPRKQRGASALFMICPKFCGECLQLPNYNFECGGKTAGAIEDVIADIKELIPAIGNYLTPGRHEQLVREAAEKGVRASRVIATANTYPNAATIPAGLANLLSLHPQLIALPAFRPPNQTTQ